jgi:hypothetical protein
MNTLCGQDAELLFNKTGGIHRYHWAAKVNESVQTSKHRMRQIIKNDEKISIRKETVVTHFTELSHHSPGETEKNHAKPYKYRW